MIFKADSFTPYALSVSHLCNGEWPGTSTWTIMKLGYKNATITAVDSESEVSTFTLTLDALLKAYDLAPENAPPPPTTSPPSPPQAGGTRHASALRTLVLVTDDQSSPYDVDPLVAIKMPIAPLRSVVMPLSRAQFRVTHDVDEVPGTYSRVGSISTRTTDTVPPEDGQKTEHQPHFALAPSYEYTSFATDRPEYRSYRSYNRTEQIRWQL